MKKTAMLLALTFLFIFPACGESGEGALSDVSVSDWFYEDVMVLRDAGVLSGYEDGTFRPHQVMTVSEFICVLAKISNEYIWEQDTEYWALNYIDCVDFLWMWNEEEAALIRPLDSFQTSDRHSESQLQALMQYFEQPIDRKRACRYLCFLVREPLSCDLELLKESTPDIRDREMDAVQYLLAAYSKGIITGDGEGNLLPDSLLTRAEACAVINRGILNPDKRFSSTQTSQENSPGIVQAEFYGTDGTRLFLLDENGTVYYLDGSQYQPFVGYPEKLMEQVLFLNQNLAVVWNHDLYGLKGSVVNYPGKGVSSVPEEYAIRVLEGVQSAVAGGGYFMTDLQGTLYHYFSDGEKGVDFKKVMDNVKNLANLSENDYFTEPDEVYALTEQGELFRLDTGVPDGAPVLCDTDIKDISGGETVFVEKNDGTKYCVDSVFYTIPIPSHIVKASVDRYGIGCYIDDKNQLFYNFTEGKGLDSFQKLADDAADVKMGPGKLLYIDLKGEAYLFGNLNPNYDAGEPEKWLLHKIYIKETEDAQ